MAKRQTCKLYKYMKTDHLKDVINGSHVLLDDGTNYNDPFELSIVGKERKTESRISGVRLTCFTNSYLNKLMWAHYADNNRGVCLTCELPVDDVYAVCYTSKRYSEADDIDSIIYNSKNYAKRNLKKDYIVLDKKQKIALLKSLCWSYEKEYRVILTDYSKYKKGTLFFYPIKISNIYLGTNFDETNDNGKEIIQLCNDKKIKTSRIKKSLDDYSFKVCSSAVE